LYIYDLTHLLDDATAIVLNDTGYVWSVFDLWSRFLPVDLCSIYFLHKMCRK